MSTSSEDYQAGNNRKIVDDMTSNIPPLPPDLSESSVRWQKTTFRVRVRNWFLTGLIVAGPLTITLWLTWWMVNSVDSLITPLVPSAYLPQTYLPFSIPGFGLVVGFIGLTLLGFLTASFFGRNLLLLGETILSRMPVVRGIYKGTKQLFETVFSADGTSFRTVGLVQFPVKGTWSLVFISNPATEEVSGSLPPDEYIGVFLPCTPNPTTGFFFYLPRKDIITLTMSVEDAAKLIMSAGVIQSKEGQAKLKTLAETAQQS